jgi:hypothetical protein
MMLRKNWDARGAFRREDRGAALDHLGQQARTWR